MVEVSSRSYEIFQPLKFQFDRMTESAELNSSSLRYQKASFSENLSDFIPPLNHSFRNLEETELTDVKKKMCSERSTEFMIWVPIFE